MTFKQQDLRDLVLHTPFQAFRVHLSDGKQLKVPHPDFALPGVSLLAVANELANGAPGELNLISYEHIVRVEMLSKRVAKA
jgi:hypothetical protein